MIEHRISRDEAYTDEPDYTSPEMQPGHGEDRPVQPGGERAVGGVAGLAMGMAGAALAGQALVEEAKAQRLAIEPHGHEEGF